MRRKILGFALAVSSVAGCATVEQHTTLSRPVNSEAFVSVGDVMVRVDVTEDLPNAFGRADIYGRTRARGFAEVRYMGLSPEGLAIFRRRDVDIQTNETTMNTMGAGTAVVSAQPAGNGVVGTGIYTQAPAPNVQALPPDTIQFALDLSQGRLITIRDKTIEIREVSATGVRFVIR